MDKQGWKLVLPAIFLALVFWFLAWLYRCMPTLIVVVISSLFVFLLVFFFRDPKRKIPSENNLVLSPADGRIDEIENLSSVDFLEGAGLKVSIFMSILNMHINRLPISGEVKYISRKPGKFIPAFKRESAKENAQAEIGIENPKIKIILRQIVGLTARRIVCNLKVGDKVKMGEKFGMIKFGSRVELVLPQSVEIRVKLGDKVKAGETIIGIFENEA